ncbi:MAG: hypothetical protein NZ530_04005 [Thermodesulfobacteriaceae bacterium]|nr:hypothetical protein [Thermodesulfobacteriaceae bacterium]MCX8042106.1 hypothetical protein [Thermodesulfobacteriaceae bacterium]MDW8136494.1 hypothetical protein [Thermodesulfobacterium sp.]
MVTSNKQSITSTKVRIEEINLLKLGKLKGPVFELEGKFRGKMELDELLAPLVLRLKEGFQIEHKIKPLATGLF